MKVFSAVQLGVGSLEAEVGWAVLFDNGIVI